MDSRTRLLCRRVKRVINTVAFFFFITSDKNEREDISEGIWGCKLDLRLL